MRHTLCSVLTDLEYLEARLAVDETGVASSSIFELLRDFTRAVESLAGHAVQRDPIAAIGRVLELEAHNLQGWEQATDPSFFLQQVAYHARIIGLKPLAER